MALQVPLNITKAVRQQKKARLLFAGPAGAGKTMSAILIMRGLVGPKGRILFLDTERGSATLYSELTEFYHCDLPNFSYETGISALEQAASLGYDGVIFDSATHYWQELLARKDKMTGNSYTNWGKITPMYDRFVQALITPPFHIAVNVRAKIKYDLDDNNKPTLIGLEPMMRDGFEYEFDAYGMIDLEHNMSIRKTRISPLADRIIHKPNEKLGEEIADWLNSGIEVTPPFYKIQTLATKLHGKPLGEIDMNLLKQISGEYKDKFLPVDVVNVEKFLATQNEGVTQ